MTQIVPKEERQSNDNIGSEKMCMVVCLDGTKYECKKVIVCAGPWTNQITEKLL